MCFHLACSVHQSDGSTSGTKIRAERGLPVTIVLHVSGGAENLGLTLGC